MWRKDFPAVILLCLTTMSLALLSVFDLQRLTDDYDRYIVLSFTNATMVLEVSWVRRNTGGVG